MNLPNKITLSRIVLIPVFIVVFYLDVIPYNYLISAGVFAIAALTDALDGYIARSRGLVTNMGKFLDPIADKVLVSTALILILTRPAVLTVYSDWELTVAGICVALILARELIIGGFRLVAVEKHAVIAADKLGKVKTTVQDIAIIVLLAEMNFVPTEGFTILSVAHYCGAALLVIATLLTVISGINYIVKNRQVLKEEK